MNRSILDFFQRTNQPKSTNSITKVDQTISSRPNSSTVNDVSKPARCSNESSGKENTCQESDDEVILKRKKSSSKTQAKRRRIIAESESDVEDEKESNYNPSDESESGENDDSDASNSPKKTPARKNKNKISEATISSSVNTSNLKSPAPSNSSKLSTSLNCSNVSSCTKNRLSSFGLSFTNDDDNGEDNGIDPKSNDQSSDKCSENGFYEHHTYDFLKPEKIMDAKKKRPDHPDYDSRTLYVPDSFKSKVTPGMRQWWEIKSSHFDTVLFFKVGKFYEMYHMDADIGVKELNLVYMKGNFAHSGFPEIAFNRMADQLVQKGYKVARIEQTESAEIAKSRTGKEKVVRREVCQISTPGTWTPGLNGEGVEFGQPTGFLLAIKEGLKHEDKEIEASSNDDCFNVREFGVAFVDTSVGLIRVGQFYDDRQCSRLRTLIAHYPPAQVLHEKDNLNPATIHILNTCLSSALKESLAPKREFWESVKTLTHLSESPYFYNEESKRIEWPIALQSMLSDSDSLGRACKPGYDLAISSLGAIVYYLRHCLLDHEILSMRQFEEYSAINIHTSNDETTKPKYFYDQQTHMVIDGITLANLDILTNSSTGRREGTLIDRLDSCVTPFGRRLLCQWVTAPLCHPDAIEERLQAVDSLMNSLKDVGDKAKEKMRKLPDLEKLITKIHMMGFRRVESDIHPDSRAVLYEEATYSKRKITDFIVTLNGFVECVNIVDMFDGIDAHSRVLKNLFTTKENGGQCPDLKNKLKFFKNAFDQDKAKKEGRIVPEKGVDEDYDNACQLINETDKELAEYLRECSQKLGTKLSYFGSARSRYQIEVPASAIKRVPNNFVLSSQKKGFQRYTTSTTETLLAKMLDAEEKKAAALKDVMRRIFVTFDKSFSDWQRMVRIVSQLDCLMALASFSRSADGDMCRPKILPLKQGENTFLDIREGRHPCLPASSLSGDYIPNDFVIGVSDSEHANTARLVLITGPNMGGKSTLMRQTALLVLLAQIGCYVPATKCEFSPVDRIFSRLGATDRIMVGESTFLVELSETASILQHAGQHSLVLLDELGRGTSTFDGSAIAFAVVKKLAANIGCRILFSTHYHNLVEELAGHEGIRLGHMACMVENEDCDDPSQESITFLYKFMPGDCPKSYGFNAARLAHIPEKIIKSGIEKAKEFEEETVMLRFVRDIVMDSMTVESAKSWIDKLRVVSS